MAKGLKTGGKDFKPGQTGNKNGRPKTPPELRKAANLTKIETLERLVKFLQMDIYGLEEVLKDKSRQVMDHWIARICLVGIKEGDNRRLDFMLDRLFGKVQPHIEINNNQFNFSGLPRDEIIARGQRALEILKQDDE